MTGWHHQFLAVLLLIVVFSGCSQPEVRETDESARIRQIDRFVEELQEMVESRDTASLLERYPPEEKQDLQALERAVRLIEDPKIELFVDRIIMDEDLVEVALHWEYRWRSTDREEVSIRRGNATLDLEGTDELRIHSIKGENPFMAPLTGKVLPP